jgi:hypothetical protein
MQFPDKLWIAPLQPAEQRSGVVSSYTTSDHVGRDSVSNEGIRNGRHDLKIELLSAIFPLTALSFEFLVSCFVS